MIFNLNNFSSSSSSGGDSQGALNFKAIGGTAEPASPQENTIWINTDAEITGWHLGVEEPNIYDIKPISASDPHYLICPHKLSEGDIVNFTIPATVTGIYEALRISDGSRFWYVRNADGGAVTTWESGTKIGLRLTETDYPIGGWGTADADGSALMLTQNSYYHEEGVVWITTGTFSPVAFNALKENAIQVCPISAKQYISGAWVDKSAKSYQGCAWVDWWDGQLYENGNQFTSVTGGWDIHDYVTNSRPLMAAEHKADQMFFQAQNNYDVLMGIDNPVDLSDVNQIRVTGKINKVFPYNGAVYGITMKVLKTKDLASKVAEFSMLVEGMFDYTLDVSNLSGEHYLTIQAFPNANINGYITGVYLI